MTELQLLMRMEKYKTNHILHLLLSVLTAGFWIPVWVIVAISNANERAKVNKKLKRLSA